MLVGYVPPTGFKEAKVEERHRVKIYGIVAVLFSSDQAQPWRWVAGHEPTGRRQAPRTTCAQTTRTWLQCSNLMRKSLAFPSGVASYQTVPSPSRLARRPLRGSAGGHSVDGVGFIVAKRHQPRPFNSTLTTAEVGHHVFSWRWSKRA